MLIYLIGLLMGVLSGMAIGGGTLLVPALVILLGVGQHTAQGICLAAFVPTAIMAVIIHYKQENINIKLAVYLTAGSLAGALLGASLANVMTAVFLKKVFGVFLVTMGLYEFFGRLKEKARR
jgi:uncharacterized membrane protein YfcA